MPRLRAGDVLRIEGVGEEFGGLYRVTSITHTLDGGGFRTQFEARKEIWFGSIPPPEQGAVPVRRDASEEHRSQTKRSSSGCGRRCSSAPTGGEDRRRDGGALVDQQRRLHGRSTRAADAAVAARVPALGARGHADGRHAARHVFRAADRRRGAGRLQPGRRARAVSSSARCGTRSTGRPRLRRPTPSPQRKIRTPLGHELSFDEALQSVTLTSNTFSKVTLDPLKAELSTPARHASSIGKDGDVTITARTKITLDAPVIEIKAATRAHRAQRRHDHLQAGGAMHGAGRAS